MLTPGPPPRQAGDLGLEQFSVSELFSSILVPGFFLLRLHPAAALLPPALHAAH